MPKNLKSLLTRSRSRNELKTQGEKPSDAERKNGDNDCKTQFGCETLSQSSANMCEFPHCDISMGCGYHVPGSRSGGSCTQLMSLNSDRTSQISSEHRSPNDFSSTIESVGDHCRPGVAMRKCETVVTLTSFVGNSRPQSPFGSSMQTPVNSTAFQEDNTKLARSKILSTSSSTINSLLYSTSRSKLFPNSWRFSSKSSSNSPEHRSAGIRDAKGNADKQHISKSQLSIPDVPLTPLNRLRRNLSSNNAFYTPNTYSRSSSLASFVWKDLEDLPPTEILCRLCLCTVKGADTFEITACSCRYCKECMTSYVSFEIQEGAEEIACPDAECERQGVLLLTELQDLVNPVMIEKHKKFRLYREVEKNGQLIWCPTPGCETICRIDEPTNSDPYTDGKTSKARYIRMCTINCGSCKNTFCAECKLSVHQGLSCESYRRKLIRQGKLSVDDQELYGLECIKKCPFCHIPIEKDSGCAQMMCKKCKHVFCWYCLASLDDDFLLRHYDKGPCKNKLGHSRASVVWHRAQVIGIFAGFGVLVLLAAPVLILAAPCLLCCRCRYCSKDADESPVHL